MRPKVSIAIPLHNEEGNIPTLHREIKEVMEALGMPYEIVLVNDGSTDRTGEILRRLAAEDPLVRVVELDGNFGEAAALSAGYRFSRGDWIVTMDGDGQNDPRDIPRILEKLQHGYRAVSGWRKERKEAFWSRVLPSRVANWLIAVLTGCRVHDTGCGLKGYEAGLVRGFSIPHGFHRFLPALFGVKGQEVAEVEVVDRQRRAGRSHYGLGRTFEVLRELLTIRFALSDPEGWRRRLGALQSMTAGGLAAAVALLALRPGTGPLVLALALLILNALIFVVRRNLSRFIRAQKEGVYKVKEVTGG